MRPQAAADEGVRRPVAAGSFYPGMPGQLAADVDALLSDARHAELERRVAGDVRGVITPHAGYRYSGPVAASAYTLLSLLERPSCVVILGLSHFVPHRGMAVPSHRAWRTPLGDVVIDGDARQAIVDAGAMVDDEVHRSEHSIEVQLPFIQRCLPGVPVLPVAAGAGDPQRGAALLDAVMTATSLLVVSTDLSHYHDADTARQLDARTAAAIEALDRASLRPDDACGFDPLRVAMAWAQDHGCRIVLLDLRNSGDTAGDPERVVGYGAFAIMTRPR